MILEINDQELELNDKKARLMELYVENKIKKNAFDNKNKELDNQLDYVRTRREDLDKDIGKFYGILRDCLKIADSSYIFFRSSSNINDLSNMIFGICSKCEIEGKKVRFLMKKPFSALCQKGSKLSWLRCINIVRTRDILDLLSLGKSIEKILQRYPV